MYYLKNALRCEIRHSLCVQGHFKPTTHEHVYFADCLMPLSIWISDQNCFLMDHAVCWPK